MCWQIPSVAALRGRQQNGIFANISVQHTCQVFFLAACGPVCHQLEHEAAYLCVSSSRPSGIGSQLTLHSECWHLSDGASPTSPGQTQELDRFFWWLSPSASHRFKVWAHKILAIAVSLTFQQNVTLVDIMTSVWWRSDSTVGVFYLHNLFILTSCALFARFRLLIANC